MKLDGSLDVTVDGTVTFTFRVTNTSEEPVNLRFMSGKRADLAVRDGDQTVWRWSDGRMFTQAIETRTLDPEQQFEQEFVWQDHEPGRYTATATLATADDVEATVTFEC